MKNRTQTAAQHGLLERLGKAIKTSSPSIARTTTELAEHARIAQDLVAHCRDQPQALGDIRLGQPLDLDVDEWLMNLPSELIRTGMVSIGMELAEGLAEIDDPNATMYLGDVAVTLGETGHAELAARRAELNLQQYPDDWWANITSGQAFAPSDPVRAERHLRAAIEIAEGTADSITISEAYEHFAEFLSDQPGGDEQASRAREALANAMSAPPMHTTAREKVGRNDQCLCGSGRKFKHCCGG